MNNYPKGYSALHRTMDYEPEIEEKNECVVDTLKLHYFEKFIRLAKRNNITLICCASPYYKAPKDDIKNEPIKQLCRQYNVPFVYFGAEFQITYNKMYFNDRKHMNDRGARSYTSKLMHQIKLKYD